MTSVLRQCSTCYAMVKVGENKQQCRLKSPSSMTADFFRAWPYVLEEDWCAEWRNKLLGRWIHDLTDEILQERMEGKT